MLRQEEIKPKIILVMGITGAGKSYLISKISGQAVKVGDRLESCTSEVDAIHMKGSDGNDIVLLDTPGFDDTNKTNSEILQIITEHLFGMYESGVKVTGIIYVHRISDIRMQGSALTNLKMFEQLCGEKTFKNVVFLTTRWDSVSEDTGKEREIQLKKKYWNLIINKGAEVKRYVDESSIMDIMGYLLGKEGIDLLIQEELSQGKKLVETGAGTVINKELADAEKKYQEELEYARAQMKEAIEQKDEETRLLIQQEAEETARKIAKIQEDRDALERNLRNELAVLKVQGDEAKKDVERLREERKEMEKEFEKRRQEIEKERERQRAEMDRQNTERQKEMDRRYEEDKKDRERQAREMREFHQQQMDMMEKHRDDRRLEMEENYKIERKNMERREEEMKKNHQQQMAAMREEEKRKQDEMDRKYQQQQKALEKERSTVLGLAKSGVRWVIKPAKNTIKFIAKVVEK